MDPLALRRIAGRLRRRARRRLEYHEVRDRAGGSPLRLFGDRDLVRRTARLHLGSGDGVSIRRRLRLWRSLPALARKSLGQAGIAIVAEDLAPELERIAPKVPRWVVITSALSADPREFRDRLSQSARDDVRKVLARGYSCQVGDPAEIPEFQKRFHAPMARTRFGDEAIYYGPAELDRVARRGDLLKVSLNGEWVSGVVCERDERCYRLRYNGVLNGNRELVQRGAIAALYWFSFLRAVELGYAKASMGAASPFVHDGLVRYKLKWDARLDIEENEWGHQYYLIDPDHPDVRSFLNRHPFVFVENGSYSLLQGAACEREPPSIPGIERRYELLEPGARSTDPADHLPELLRGRVRRLDHGS